MLLGHRPLGAYPCVTFKLILGERLVVFCRFSRPYAYFALGATFRFVMLFESNTAMFAGEFECSQCIQRISAKFQPNESVEEPSEKLLRLGAQTTVGGRFQSIVTQRFMSQTPGGERSQLFVTKRQERDALTSRSAFTTLKRPCVY